MIVVDASVIAPALADDNDDGDLARARLKGERLVAPELIDLEVVSVIRKGLSLGALNERRAGQALGDLADLKIERVSHRSLLPRIWELRSNLTPYDAAYVALAEAIDATLVTGDGPLSRAPGVDCEIEHLSASKS